MVYIQAGNAVGVFADHVIGHLGLYFWIVLGVAVVVRVVVALVRRRPGNIKRDVLKPFTRSGAVLSEAYGWKPADSQVDLQVTEQHEVYRIYPTGPDDTDTRHNGQ